MKTALLLTLCLASSVWAQERLPADAPVIAEEAAPPRVFPPGDLAPGQSVELKKGEPAPYSGQLLDDQELVRRSRVKERALGELGDLKKGNTILSTPVFVAIIAGAFVAGAAAATGITVAAMKPKP